MAIGAKIARNGREGRRALRGCIEASLLDMRGDVKRQFI